MTFPDGEKYIGEVKDGNYHGQGTHIWSDGSKYVGEFKENKFHGQGTYTYADGSRYVGEFKVGLQNGQGTYTWSDGEKYVGKCFKYSRKYALVESTETENGDDATGECYFLE